MDIIRRGGRYPAAERKLIARGLLQEFPTQRAVTTTWKDGIDITFRFQKMGPKHFEESREFILKAAYEEGRRYEEIPNTVRFTTIDVRIKKPGTTKWFTRTYTAANHTDSYIMVYGPGYEVYWPDFLIDVMDLIKEIPERYKTHNYKLINMVVSIRDTKWALKIEEMRREEKRRKREIPV